MGPKTPEGKQRSAMNAFKQWSDGTEPDAPAQRNVGYNRLTAAMLSDLKPKTKPLGRYEPSSRVRFSNTPGVRASQKERIACERAEREADPRGERHENKRDHFDLASFGATAPEMFLSANPFRVLTQLPLAEAPQTRNKSTFRHT
jgi:hypothetical protein